MDDSQNNKAELKKPGKNIDGQQAHEEMLSITNY